MSEQHINIYILKLADEHETENISVRYKGLQYLTGFTGSYGKAIVINGLGDAKSKHKCDGIKEFNTPYLQTDERYYIQSDRQLQHPWQLAKDVHKVFNTLFKFVNAHTQCVEQFKTNKINIYTDSSVINADYYYDLLEVIKKNGADSYTEFNLSDNIDLIKQFWVDRPELPKSTIFIHEMKQAGESALSKLNDIKSDLHNWQPISLKGRTPAEKKILKGKGNNLEQSTLKSILNQTVKKAVFIIELDDIAWILNLRGSDTEYSPMFYSFLWISDSETILFVNQDRPNFEHIRSYLNKLNVIVKDQDKLKLHEFLKIKNSQKQLVQCDMVKLDIKRIFGDNIIASDEFGNFKHLPVKIKYRKSVRNKTSLKAERNSQIKDSLALIRYFGWLHDKQISNINIIRKCSNLDCKKKQLITEWDGVLKLEEFKKTQPLYFGASFDTISASGPNAAMVHYMPTSDEHDLIAIDKMQMVDQGGNYLDGTTDITRTICFQTQAWEVPQQFKDAYTTVLKGNISILMTVQDKDTPQTVLNDMGTQQLPKGKGGTVGHGIGAFLSEHEFPGGTQYDFPIYNNQVISDEPSLEYENKLGIRIEDDIVAKQKSLSKGDQMINDKKYGYYGKLDNFYNEDNNNRFKELNMNSQPKTTRIKNKNKQLFMKNMKRKKVKGQIIFVNMSLVPFDLKLIDRKQLNQKEINQINWQSRKIRKEMIPRLEKVNDKLAIKWLMVNTEPIK